jgi:hypothetical protein
MEPAPAATVAVATGAAPLDEAKRYADQIYAAVKASIGTRRVTVASVTIMITTAMVEVEKITTLTGPEKKELVLHVVGRLVDEIPLDQEDRAVIRSAVMLFGPAIIDTIVAASKGQFNINVGQLGPAPGNGCCGGNGCCVLL